MPPTQHRPKVIIVGAGATGTMLAIQLLRMRWRRGLHLVLVERTGRFGPGVAYRTEEPFHLLNTPARAMSVLPDSPDHFTSWAIGRDRGASGHDFLPRSWFGRYLEESLDEAVRAAARGVWLERRVTEAIGLETTLDEEPWPGALEQHRSGRRLIRLRLADGCAVSADRVVLALGTLPPAPPGAEGLDRLDDRRYVADPWDNAALSRLSSSRRVLLIGTGLTMADVVLWLHGHGNAEAIYAVSRHGWLPRAHCPPGRQAPPGPQPGVPGLELRLLRSRGATTRGLLRMLRQQAATDGGGEVGWQAAMDAIRPQVQRIWAELPDDERRRFLRHGRRLWDVHRHLLPPEVRSALAKLADEGRLQVHAGRLRSVAERPDGLEVLLSQRSTGCQRLVVDHIVNCTGPSTDVRRSDSRLLQGLLAGGLARPGPFGLGLDTASDGALLDREGRPWCNLFVAGSARRGQLWEITSIAELRDQVCQLATGLYADLGSGPRLPRPAHVPVTDEERRAIGEHLGHLQADRGSQW